MTNNFQDFSKALIDKAKEYSEVHRNSQEISLGSKKIKLFFSPSGKFYNLISTAFISNNLELPNFATIHVWDSSFPGKLPDFTFAEEYIVRNTVVPEEMTLPYRVLFDRGQGFIFVFDTAKREGVVWHRDFTMMDEKCFVAPFRIILSWIAAEFNSEIIHAAAVEISEKAILISGPSGSGKSSLALIALQNSLPVLTDDALILESDGKVFPLYRKIKTNSDNPILDLDKISTLKREQLNEGKLIISLPESDSEKQPLTIGAMVFPILAHVAAFSRINKDLAGEFLLRHSLRELFGGLPSNKKRIEKMLNDYPSFRLAISGNPQIDLMNLLKIGNNI